MTTFPTVVGVTGYAQHGKDTFAQRLVERHGFKRFAFADPLKSLALTLDPIIIATEEPLYFRPAERLSQLVEAFGWERAKANPEVRRFLQVLGTEGVRNHLGDDSWVRACGQAFLADGAERVVITDCRFPNEADYIRRVCGGSLVRVTRPGFDNGVGTEHPSELHIARLPVDFEVANDAGLIDLYLRADAVVADIEEGFGRRTKGVVVEDITDPSKDGGNGFSTEYELEVHEALTRRYQGEGL